MIKKLKIMTIFGTRPEIIRLSRILPKMDKYFNHIQVYTNQSYDYELSRIFFEQLELRQPNYILNVKADTLGGQIANILSQTEKVMIDEKPDGLLVLGDTNSALSTIIAKRLKIPIFHMEAGNRAYDWNVPEEINRRIVDHLADINLPYTEHSRRYLLTEGIHPGSIYVTGSPLREVLDYYKKLINGSTIINKLKLKPKEYFIVSIHREENVDNNENLVELFSSLNYLVNYYQIPAIISLHPRTKIRLKKINFKLNSLIRFYPPFGYFDYNKLQINSRCCLSDSGTIQEESAMLGFSAIQVRQSSERPEAFDSGSIILTGFNKDIIVNAINFVIDHRKEPLVIPADYFDINISSKVVKIILGLSGIQKKHAK